MLLLVPMLGERRAALILLLILCSVWISSGNLKVVKADSTDYIRYSSGVTIFSPLHTTYNSRFLALNLTYAAGLGIEHSLNYSIDGKYEGPIPLTSKNPTELHVVNVQIGYVTLPELSEGSHCLTVNVLCGLYNYHGANLPGAPFIPTFPGSSDYIATWTHTIFFTIDTSIPEFPSWIILPLFATATLIVVLVRKRLMRT